MKTSLTQKMNDANVKRTSFRPIQNKISDSSAKAYQAKAKNYESLDSKNRVMSIASDEQANVCITSLNYKSPSKIFMSSQNIVMSKPNTQNKSISLNNSLTVSHHELSQKLKPAKPNEFFTKKTSVDNKIDFVEVELEGDANNKYICIWKRKESHNYSGGPCSNFCAFLSPRDQKDIILSDKCQVAQLLTL